MSSPFSSFALGPLRLRNRIVKTATYEGMTPGGAPSAALTRHHGELARGGVAMTTVAYAAISREGRTFDDQLWLRDDVVPALRALTGEVHRGGAAAAIQLAHAGAFTKSRTLGLARPISASAVTNPYGVMAGRPLARAMSQGDMERVAGEFVTAACLARSAGFDAVELHLGHGYLLSQWLSPRSNRRRDEHGGVIANRLRFPLEILRRVREAVPELAVLAKTNLSDGVPGGLEIDDAIEVARGLEREGADAIVLSGGLVVASSMFLLRGETPLAQMIDVEKSALQKVALRLLGPQLVRAVPYEPMFFLPLARRIRAAVRAPLVLLGGITDRAHLDVAMEAGFELVAIGRALLHDPELVSRWARGEDVRSGCTHCNRCIAEMDRPGGVVCSLVPAQLARRDAEVRGRVDS
ncbi:MAG: NADH:flavin oxidoreductase [Myxococcota bacterium]|nr:NADH:flavin oxidoreductase [Myxococcota bacterium]